MKSDSRPRLMVLLAALVAGTVWAGSNEWTNVGPQSPGVGFLVFDPQSPGTVYTGTGVGLFKSKDGGASWSNAGLNGWSVTGLVIDPTNPSTLYAATQRYADDNFDTNKVFKSTDGGVTWNEADAGLPADDPCGLKLLPIAQQNAATLYEFAGCPPKLFKSTDGGTSWAPAAGLLSSLYAGLRFVNVAIDPQNSSTLYAAAQGADPTGHAAVAVFKSRDGGASWSETDSGLPGAGKGQTTFVFFGALAIDPKNPNTVYVTRFGIGVYRSTDGGASWHAANSGLPNLTNDYEFMSCCGSGVVIDPQNSNTLYVPGQNPVNTVILKSTNGGASWKAVSSLGPAGGLQVLAIDPQGTVYANYRLKSTDGGVTWNPATFRLRDIPVPSLAIDPQSPGTLYAGASKSTDAGTSWYSASTSFGGSVVALAIDPQVPGTVYAGTSESKIDDDGDPVPCGSSSVSGIFKSVDGGTNWMDTQAGIGCLSAIVIDPHNPSTVYAGSWYHGGVYKSTDGGMSWSAMNSGLPGGPAGVHIDALAVDPKNPGTLYAATGGGLFKSTDGGASWSDAGLTPMSYALAIDPQNTSTVYAATPSGLFKSTDGGAGWRNLFPSSPASVYSVAINPQNPGTLYAGTDNGVAQSTDGGESWTPIPGGPGRIRLLALDPQDPNTVYAGGPGGLFAISLAALVLAPSRVDLPQPLNQ